MRHGNYQRQQTHLHHPLVVTLANLCPPDHPYPWPDRRSWCDPYVWCLLGRPDDWVDYISWNDPRIPHLITVHDIFLGPILQELHRLCNRLRPTAQRNRRIPILIHELQVLLDFDVPFHRLVVRIPAPRLAPVPQNHRDTRIVQHPRHRPHRRHRQ
jgi:hypothetical protein